MVDNVVVKRLTHAVARPGLRLSCQMLYDSREKGPQSLSNIELF